MTSHSTPLDPLPKVWDPDDRIGDMLKGKRGLVVGVANAQSIAFGCAAKLRAFGAELVLELRTDGLKQLLFVQIARSHDR